MNINTKQLFGAIINLRFFATNVLMIFSVIFMSFGCIDNEPFDICGSYSKDDKTRLEIYDNNTFSFIERQGYLMGKEINFSVFGTWELKTDIIIFTGDGVTTTGHIRDGNIITDENVYTKITQ
jgi:hypothetical protein